ncbi:MAG: hypothetical protein WA982_03650 [Rubrobacteraceae bacterium]
MSLNVRKTMMGAAEISPDRSQEYEAGAKERDVEWAVYAAALLSLVAALIHLWATPEHFNSSWWGYGAFFVATALAQGCLAIAVLRWPNTPVCVAGIIGNLAIIAMYVVTRTSGVPVGPEAGMIEDPGLLDMASMVAQVGIVIVLAALLGDLARRRMINALFLVGAAAWLLKFMGFIY